MNRAISYAKLEKRMAFQANEKRAPLSGAFELLPLCNLRCQMCYLRKAAESCHGKCDLVPLEQWLGIAEELLEAGTLFLLLTGGEPWIYPDFHELYERLHGMGFILTINTNGTLISKEEAEFLASHMPRRVNVTLYGTSPETYEKVTGDGKAFHKAMEGIRHLVDAGVPVKINVSLIPENVDELGEFYRIGGELQVPLEVNSYMYPTHRDTDNSYDDAIRLTPERAAQASLENDRMQVFGDIYDQYLSSLAQIYLKVQPNITKSSRQKPLNPEPDYDKKITNKTECQESPMREALPCRAARSAFWINWQCQLTSCVFLEQKRISLYEDTFASAWEKITRNRDHIYLPAECSNCLMRPHCLICGAAAYHENGQMDQKPDYLCRMTREKLRLAYDILRDS